jgi:hypothetical protein
MAKKKKMQAVVRYGFFQDRESIIIELGGGINSVFDMSMPIGKGFLLRLYELQAYDYEIIFDIEGLDYDGG